MKTKLLRTAASLISALVRRDAPEFDGAKPKAPAVAGEALGGEPGNRRLVAATLAEEVRAAVKRGRLLDVCGDLLGALVKHAVAQVAAATPAPLDDASTDKWRSDDIKQATDARTAARLGLSKAHEARHKSAQRLAALPAPWSAGRWAVVVACSLFVAGSTIAAITALTAPSFHAYVLRGYLRLILGDPAGPVGAALATYLAAACAIALVVPQWLAVLVTSGRIGAGVKILFLVADVFYSASFAALRLVERFSFAALAVSGFELAVLLACLLAMLAIAAKLREDADRRPPYCCALAELAVANDECAAARDELTGCDARLELLRAPARERDIANRLRPQREALAAATVEAEYLTCTSELIADATTRPAARTLTGLIEKHLREEFSALGGQRHLHEGSNGKA